MGGGLGGRVEEMVTAGLIWAPGEKRLVTQEKLGRNGRAGNGKRKCLEVGVTLGWQLNLELGGFDCFELE